MNKWEKLFFEGFSSQDHRINEALKDNTDGANSVIVCSNGVIYKIWVGVGVDHSNNRDIEAAGFMDSDVFTGGVNDNNSFREFFHVTNTTKVTLEFDAFTIEASEFFF